MISSSLYTDEWADNSPIRGSATADLSPSKVPRLGIPPTRTTSRNTPIPIGDLLLLPRPFNAGHNDNSYEKKLPRYLSRTCSGGFACACRARLCPLMKTFALHSD